MEEETERSGQAKTKAKAHPEKKAMTLQHVLFSRRSYLV